MCDEQLGQLELMLDSGIDQPAAIAVVWVCAVISRYFLREPISLLGKGREAILHPSFTQEKLKLTQVIKAI